MARLQFLGAIRQVTGSCYRIESAAGRVLLECGMVQGERRDHEQQDEEHPFAFDPAGIDAVVLSHAHLDHSGMLPRLVRDGFRGPIYATRATADLLAVLLKDAAFLQQKDIEWENRRRLRSGRELIEPLYDMDDVDKTLGLIEPVDYGNETGVLDDIRLRFNDAGHILGSAIVELWIADGGRTCKLVFTGDLGNSFSPLLPDPALIGDADVVLLESTYGDRNHRPADETLDEFRGALEEAMHDGGNMYIPSFAVGRSQDLLYHLGAFYREGKLGQQKVFLDSPMATSVSELYIKHRNLYNRDNPEFNQVIGAGWESWLPVLDFTRTTEESMALNRITSGAVVIAGSGMCTGGRIRHHLKHNLWRRNNHIAFVGFQARRTLGRALVDGAKRVKIMGDEIVVKAKIHTLGGFSAHAGQDQLLEWAGRIGNRPKLYLVHGELDKMLALQQRFIEQHDWYANIPSLGKSIEL